SRRDQPLSSSSGSIATAGGWRFFTYCTVRPSRRVLSNSSGIHGCRVGRLTIRSSMQSHTLVSIACNPVSMRPCLWQAPFTLGPRWAHIGWCCKRCRRLIPSLRKTPDQIAKYPVNELVNAWARDEFRDGHRDAELVLEAIG